MSLENAAMIGVASALEMVVISLMPPNSAALFTSLTRISAIPSNDEKVRKSGRDCGGSCC